MPQIYSSEKDVSRIYCWKKRLGAFWVWDYQNARQNGSRTSLFDTKVLQCLVPPLEILTLYAAETGNKVFMYHEIIGHDLTSNFYSGLKVK